MLELKVNTVSICHASQIKQFKKKINELYRSIPCYKNTYKKQENALINILFWTDGTIVDIDNNMQHCYGV